VRRAVLLAVLLTSAAAGMAGCGGGGANAEGQQACAYVETSLRLYAEAVADQRAGDAARASSERAQALSQLRLALPLAARAVNADGTWQPLEATLSESNRVPEGNLVTALTDQCQGVGTT
jgi:ABC-type phosphate/phosphonate transport system substrate-binding protein